MIIDEVFHLENGEHMIYRRQYGGYLYLFVKVGYRPQLRYYVADTVDKLIAVRERLLADDDKNPVTTCTPGAFFLQGGNVTTMQPYSEVPSS